HPGCNDAEDGVVLVGRRFAGNAVIVLVDGVIKWIANVGTEHQAIRPGRILAVETDVELGAGGASSHRRHTGYLAQEVNAARTREADNVAWRECSDVHRFAEGHPYVAHRPL